MEETGTSIERGNIPISLWGIAHKAWQKTKNTEPEKAEGRLEWVAKNNPEIDIERISRPSEEHELGREFLSGKYRDNLTKGVKCTIAAAACAAASSWGFHELSEFSEGLRFALYSCAALFPIGPGILAAMYAPKFLSDGIKTYKIFRDSKWYLPLTEKEKNLADYIFTNDQKERQ